VVYARRPMTDPQQLLRAMPVLRGIPRDELAALPSQTVQREVGEVFFRQKDPGDAAYGIVTGRVGILKGEGGREVCLEVLGPGDLVAAVAVMRKMPMPATAEALEHTLCLSVPADAFRKLLAAHPSAGMRMLDLVSRRLLQSAQARQELATLEVEVRLARALLRLADKYASERAGQLVFSQNLTRQNLADLAGTTVESTIRVMSRWTRADIIRSAAQRITIQDPQALRRIAEGPDASG
jgi:CRP/FNR family transcriptional regulator, nitrogen oxide reductase regulator